MFRKAPPWQHRLRESRRAFLKGRRPVSEAQFIEEIGLMPRYAWVVSAVRAVVAGACGIEAEMIHADDRPGDLTRMMLWEGKPKWWTSEWTLETFARVEFWEAFERYCEESLGIVVPNWAPGELPFPFEDPGFSGFFKWLFRPKPAPETFGQWVREAVKSICDAQPEGWPPEVSDKFTS